MSENRRQILNLLAEGKINADEAERLLKAVEMGGETGHAPAVAAEGRRPKYLRILVESEEGYTEHGEPHAGPTKVNIRVPMQLLRAGVKLASLIPIQVRDHVNEALREQGIQVDLTRLKPEDLEELIDQLNELTVDVDEAKNKVRIFCE